MGMGIKRSVLATYFAAFTIAAMVGACLPHLVLEAQQPTPAQSAQAQLAQAYADLGDCQSKASEGSRLKSEVVAGNIVTWVMVKKAIESTNPTLVFDVVTHKVTIKTPADAPVPVVPPMSEPKFSPADGAKK